MKVCDICGGKDGVEISKYPQVAFYQIGGTRAPMDERYYRDTDIDVCEQCRKEIYEHIEHMKERLK